MSILMREYDYETDIRVKQQDAYEQGAYQTKLETAKAFLAEGLAPAMVARCTDLPLKTVQDLMES